MNQASLPFDANTKARTTDPATSHAAARAARGVAADHQRKILEVMRCGEDWTADEIALHCDLDRHQIGRRLGELERASLVRRTTNTRATATGRMAGCYAIVRP